MTSLTFMLDWVPEPVCQIRNGNSSARVPSITSHGRALDEPRLVGVEFAEFVVHQRRGQLQDAKGLDQSHRHGLVADREVVQAALGLRPPVVLRGDLDLSHRVGLKTNGHVMSLST